MALQLKEERIEEKMNELPVVDVNVKINIPHSAVPFDESKHKFKCACCGKGFTTRNGNFNKTNDVLFQANEGYLPWCRDCVSTYVTQITALYSGNEELAMKDFCQRAGWNYDINPLLASRETFSGHRDRHRILHYAAKKNLNCGGRKTFIDTIKFNYENRKDNVIETIDDAKELGKVKLKTVRFWGTGFSDEDYIYLQDQYEDWTQRHECKTKAQEEIFKRICFKQLEILKATRAGLSTKDLDATYQNLLATGNLQPKQTNMDALAEDRTFGQLIRIWEDEKPIPKPDKDFEDVDGIGKYISVFFLGHLAKMVGIKNRFSRMYDEEMAKYTVNKPEYEEDTEALFDAIFGGHLESSKDSDGE